MTVDELWARLDRLRAAGKGWRLVDIHPAWVPDGDSPDFTRPDGTWTPTSVHDPGPNDPYVTLRFDWLPR